MVTQRVLFWWAVAVGILPAAAAERPLVIDAAQSRVEVVVKASVDSFTGKLAKFEPTVAVADDGRVCAARLAFHFRDVLTGKDGRDKAMHKWQDTEKFPDGLFVLTSLEPASAPGNGLVAIGRFTFHGVARDLRFPVTVGREAEIYAIDGIATIDTREYGLPVIRMLALLKVDPLVQVKFHLQGRVAR